MIEKHNPIEMNVLNIKRALRTKYAVYGKILTCYIIYTDILLVHNNIIKDQMNTCKSSVRPRQ